MIVSNVLTLDIDELTPKEWQKLFHRLRYMADGEIYEPWKVMPSQRHIAIPRGAWSLVPDHVEYVDRRVLPEMPELDFNIELDTTTPDGRTFERQWDAVNSILAQEQGLVVRPPGTGKTNIVLVALCLMKTRSLVLVHTKDILEQWVNRISNAIPNAELGVIQGGKFEIGHITVATVQTFRKRLDSDPKLRKMFGAVVLDEAHHAAATTFETILNEMHAQYRIGVTATRNRADGKHPYMQIVIGPIIHSMKFKSKVPVEVVPVKEHKFAYRMRGTWDYRNLLNKLIDDEKRNAAIAKHVARAMREGHSVLVLSREIKHLDNIREELALAFDFDEGWTQQIELLAAKRVSDKDRKSILEKFTNGEITCVLATQLADEALDVPILSCVVLTFPGKHDGRIIQQVGRALREHPGKNKALIIDVMDDRVSVLRRQALQRRQAYKKMGIPIKRFPKAKFKLRRR